MFLSAIQKIIVKVCRIHDLQVLHQLSSERLINNTFPSKKHIKFQQFQFKMSSWQFTIFVDNKPPNSLQAVSKNFDIILKFSYGEIIHKKYIFTDNFHEKLI